jgi:hypothetical protein
MALSMECSAHALGIRRSQRLTDCVNRGLGLARV